MIDKRMWYKIYITHLMVNGVCKEPCALISIDLQWNL